MGVEYSLSETGPQGGNVTVPEKSTLLVCLSGRITAMEMQGIIINSGIAGFRKQKCEELVLLKILVALKTRD